jgi:hypothetical protein
MSDKNNTAEINFSQNLFWDMDATLLEMNKNKRFIIQRVLEYGTRSDWEIIKHYYGIDNIVKEMQKARSLDKTSLAFISAITNTKKEDFRCYTLKRSHPQHWNF